MTWLSWGWRSQGDRHVRAPRNVTMSVSMFLCRFSRRVRITGVWPVCWDCVLGHARLPGFLDGLGNLENGSRTATLFILKAHSRCTRDRNLSALPAAGARHSGEGSEEGRGSTIMSPEIWAAGMGVMLLLMFLVYTLRFALPW
jgi:hypothetical protein